MLVIGRNEFIMMTANQAVGIALMISRNAKIKVISSGVRITVRKKMVRTQGQ